MNYSERNGIAMGQGFNNIDNISLANKAIHTYNKEKVSDASDTSLSFQGNESSNYIYDGAPARQTKFNKTMDQFEEYLKQQQEKAKEAGTDEESKAKADEEAANEIRNNLTSEEIKQLAMLGIDIESVKLRDVMGMINTLRADAHKEEMTRLFARIKADNGDMDNLVVSGGGVTVAGTDVKVDGVSVSEMADNGFTLGRDELVYLLRNELALHKDNLYKAHYSGIRETASPMKDADFEEMMGQIKDIMEDASVEGFTIEDARFLLDNDLPVNEESMKLVSDYNKLQGQNINEIKIPVDEEEYLAFAGAKVYEELKNIKPETVMDMAIKGKRITIKGAFEYQKIYEKTSSGLNEKDDFKDNIPINLDRADEGTIRAITARRQLEEIRLAMTMEASNRIVRLDVNIDTKELAEVIDTLKSMERINLEQRLNNAGVPVTDENVDMLADTTKSIEELRLADTKILGSVVNDREFTIRSLRNQVLVEELSAGTGDALSRRFDNIKKSYESVGTSPRSDMGDSINKAFSNIEDLLKSLDIRVDNETVRAARILGYNSIEITRSNIDSIVSYDRQINQLMDSFYPEAVMGLIKDGINPMDIPVDELNEIIAKQNYNGGVTEAADFATYLRDLERQGELTPEQRESYIGIYRIMDKLAKSGDREAGFIFANKANLTIRNMITAMRSRKARGIDAGIDDSFGMLDKLEKYGKAIDEQIMAGFSDESLDDTYSGESKAQEEASVLEADIEKFSRLNANVEQYIRELGIENTIQNALAVDTIINQQGGLYQAVYELMSKLRFRDTSKEELVDEATEDISVSLVSEAESPDVMEDLVSRGLSMDNLLRKLGETGELSLTYEDIRNQLTEMMYAAGQMGTLSVMDVAAIKNVSAGFNVMSHMAKQDRYQIPVDTETGTTVINLTIKNNTDQTATVIDIRTSSDKLGNITAKLKLVEGQAGKGVYGSIFAETTEGKMALLNMLEEQSLISEEITKETGIEEINISFGSAINARELNLNTSTGGSRADACRVAVSAVKAIAQIIK